MRLCINIHGTVKRLMPYPSRLSTRRLGKPSVPRIDFSGSKWIYMHHVSIDLSLYCIHFPRLGEDRYLRQCSPLSLICSVVG